MKTLRDYAKDHNIQYRAAWNRFKAGKIPEAFKDASGYILIPESKAEYTVCYARVLSKNNYADMRRQVDKLTNYCLSKGWSIDCIVEDISPDPCLKDNKLMDIIGATNITRLVAVNSDVLSIYAFGLIHRWANSKGCDIVLLEPNDQKSEDIIWNTIKLISRFVCSLYGTRKSGYKTARVLKTLLRNSPKWQSIKNSLNNTRD